MSRQFTIPDSLVHTRSNMPDAVGTAWLHSLPFLLAECERRWSLTISSPFPHLSYNYAASAICADGTNVVVKVCSPDREFMTEIEALRVYAGEGTVQLRHADLDLGVLLLEHIRPGTLLLTIEDDIEAISIAASVMRQLRKPVPGDHSFPSVSDWAKGLTRLRRYFGDTTGPFPEKLVDEAEHLFADLLASMSEPVVLHGDLHHFNILAAERQPWLAIDPKGVVGEPEYETGALLRNPTPYILSDPQPGATFARRVRQLADELDFDPKRIRDWAVAQAVLSAWWSVEDHGYSRDVQTFLAFAEALAAAKV